MEYPYPHQVLQEIFLDMFHIREGDGMTNPTDKVVERLPRYRIISLEGYFCAAKGNLLLLTVSFGIGARVVVER